MVASSDEHFREMVRDSLLNIPNSKVAAEYQEVAANLYIRVLQDLERNPTAGLIVDISGDPDGAIKAVEKVKQAVPDLFVIVANFHADAETVIQCMRAGANEFLLQPIKRTEFRDAMGRLDRHPRHGVAGESNTTRIRNVYTTVANGRAVYVNADNKIGTLSSSRRFKHDIQPMDRSSETLFALKPVTFRYKKDADPSQALSFGLIAEDVAQVSPELITRDEEGKPQTVRYEAVNAMLLNEFLKEHRKLETQTRKVDDQEAKIAQQQKEIQTLMASVRQQSAQIQKVNARLEASNAVFQTASSDR